MAGPRLTVLQLLPSLEGGGVEQGTVDMAEGLVEAGHRALVVSAGGPMVANVNAVGGEHVEMAIGAKTPLTLRYVPALKRMLREQKVDILHLRSRMPAWIGYFAWRALPVDRRPRLVSTVHGFYSVNRYSRIMLRGERVICVSRSIRDYVLANYPETDPNAELWQTQSQYKSTGLVDRGSSEPTQVTEISESTQISPGPENFKPSPHTAVHELPIAARRDNALFAQPS